MFSFIITGIAADGAATAFKGFLDLQFQPARLISDFMSTSGVGASFINAAVVGAIGLSLIVLSKVQLSGSTFAAIFTMMGFAGGLTAAFIVSVIAWYRSGNSDFK